MAYTLLTIFMKIPKIKIFFPILILKISDIIRDRYSYVNYDFDNDHRFILRIFLKKLVFANDVKPPAI